MRRSEHQHQQRGVRAYPLDILTDAINMHMDGYSVAFLTVLIRPQEVPVTSLSYIYLPFWYAKKKETKKYLLLQNVGEGPRIRLATCAVPLEGADAPHHNILCRRCLEPHRVAAVGN